jgi:hypothetical protein
MAITTYAELQTALGNWLNRSDLTSRYPEFIALAEPGIRRTLRSTTDRSTGTLVAGTETLTLPTGAKSVVSLVLTDETFTFPLRPVTPNQLARLHRAGTGRPAAFAVVGTTLYFDVTPDDAYAYTLVVVGGLSALSGGNPTNTVLTSSPDIYLYGALAQAAPYLEHDERVPLWVAAYEKAIVEENIARERVEFPTGQEPDLPVTFGEDNGY